jgi:L-malate glycosyltransferase
VLLAAPSLEIVGGQSVQAARLLKELKTRSEVVVAFQPINPRLPGPLTLLRRLKYVRTITTEAIYLFQLFRRIPRCDVVHVFSAGYWSFLLAPVPALLLGRLFRKTTIANYHDGRADDHLRNSRLATRLMRIADRIVTPSGFLVDVFAAFGLSAQAIGNIVDASQFGFREREHPRPKFLHNRGLEPVYNVPCTLRAFAMVQARFPEASLSIAHDGPLRDTLERMVREMGLHNVTFLGSVSQAEMRELYAETDIYLMSPNMDNMPLSVLECYASGLPVVSTAAGGVPYMVANAQTGLLVPLNDHSAMAQAAIRLMEEPGLARDLSRNGFSECQKYTGPAVASQWVTLYQDLSLGAHAEK